MLSLFISISLSIPGESGRFFVYDSNLPCSESLSTCEITFDWNSSMGFGQYLNGAGRLVYGPRDFSGITLVAVWPFSSSIDPAHLEALYNGWKNHFSAPTFAEVRIDSPVLHEIEIGKNGIEGSADRFEIQTITNTEISGACDIGKLPVKDVAYFIDWDYKTLQTSSINQDGSFAINIPPFGGERAYRIHHGDD